MIWRSVSTPLVAAALLGAVIALALLSQPAPRQRKTKAEKRVCFGTAVVILCCSSGCLKFRVVVVHG